MGNHKHNPAPENVLNRQKARSVSCPKCGADPGQNCIGVRVKKRAASHIGRWQAYRNKEVGYA